jgi:hypothetical protein
MSRARSSIHRSLLAVALCASLALLAGTAAAVSQTDVALQGRGGERYLAGGPTGIDAGPHAETYFGHFTIDDAVLGDDGQRLAASVRALAIQISGEQIAALPTRVDVARPGGPSAGARGLAFVDGRLVRGPQDSLGNAYLDVLPGDDNGSSFGNRQGGGGLDVIVAEPSTWSLVAIGLVTLLAALRRRLAS